ncbi:MAG: Dps family protein [Bacillota bacterium]
MNLGLDPAKTQEVVCGLNLYLANLHVLYAKLHNYHWNVIGCNFFEFHEKLQELYEFVGEEIDRIAERILMLGYKPVASLCDALKIATVKEMPSVNYSAQTIACSVVNDFVMVVNQLRRVADIAGQMNDEYTIVLLGEAIGFYEKHIWMFRAYLIGCCGGTGYREE